MKRLSKAFFLLIYALVCTLGAQAVNYMTYLTVNRGFTEVKSTDDILTDDYFYLLAAAENTNLIVGIGRYEAKPGWAGEDTKALRYRNVDSDLILDLTNFFTIEREGQYIGLRNVMYNSSLFQTHDNAGYMYVLTYTEPTMSDWCYLTPTFQNNYWLFESGKYPMSSNNWACGYLGPWNKVVKASEPIALNRRNTTDDAAGHYRLFRIAKDKLLNLYKNNWQRASNSTQINATWRITNPSFETGDETGWILNGKTDDDTEFKVCDYGMTNKSGTYLMNAYAWWKSLSVSQTVSDIPSGRYKLSAVVAAWEGHEVTFSGNDTSINTTGQGDGTGIPVSMDVTIGKKGELKISASSIADWWSEGRTEDDRWKQCFFKLDNVRLNCTGIFLDGISIPLPTDGSTLVANQWYYFETTYQTEYWLSGNISGMEYSTDGQELLSNITTQAAQREMMLQSGRTYFRTPRKDVRLKIRPERELYEGTFTAVALNVDGLPNTVAWINLNEDGPGRDGTLKISQYLASKNYDIIGCSEDFNYNGALMEYLNDRYSCGTIRKTLSVSGLSGGLPFDTDGLNLIWKNDAVNATGESWTRWNSMVETDGNQYVKKGYRHYDMHIGNQVFDVYILHMDAGDTNATASREDQWRQLTDAINSSDLSRPKLIIGDTNSRWTREDIITNFMNRLNGNLTASDVWVEFYKDGIYPTTDMNDLTDGSDPENYANYEIVDKIIYINPKAVNTMQLTPQSFKIEYDYTYDYVDHDGNTTPLGDHRPVVVSFRYNASGADRTTFQTPNDLDFDDCVTISDVNALINILLGKDNGSTHQYDHEAADINGDNKVTIADLTALVNIILGK